MSVSFKAKLLSAITNAAYISKTTADIALAKLGLSDSDTGNNSGAPIDNTQKFINQLADSSGETENDANRKVYSSNNYIANGDSKKVTIGKLDTQVKVNADDVQAINDSIGQPDGIASLDSGGQVPASQLPSYVDDVEEYADLASFPVTGETGKIYVALDTNITYRWSGSVYIEISPNLVDSVNGYTGTVVLNKTDIGLGNVTDDAQLKRAGGDIDTFTEKVTTVVDDIVLIEDSEDLFNKKKVKLSSITTDTSDKADTDLGNLATTSINQSLIPSADQFRDLGSASKKWAFAHVTNLQAAQGGDINGAWVMGDSFASNQLRIAGSSGFTFKGITINGYVRSVGANKTVAVYSESASQSGKVLIASGDASSGSSGDINIVTGDSTIGTNTGKVSIKTGTGGSTRGDIDLEANAVNLNSTIVKNGVDPVDPQDLATKNYADSLGGGGGGLETYYTNDFEKFLIADIQETGNGTYGAGGTFDGALSIDTVEIIAGDQSLRYTASTASANDYFIIDSVSVRDREKAVTNARSKWVNAINFTGAADLIIYDQTNSTIIKTQPIIPGQLKEYLIDYDISNSTNIINFGVLIKTATSGEYLIFDNVQLTTDPFVFANLSNSEHYTATIDAAGTTVTSINELSSSNDGIFTTPIINGSGFVEFTVLSPALFFVNGGSRATNNAADIQIFVDGVSRGRSYEVISFQDPSVGGGSLTEKLNKDAVVTVKYGNQDSMTDNPFSVSAIATTEHVVAPLKNNSTNWQNYVPSSNGFNSITVHHARWAQVGPNVLVEARITPNLPGAFEAQIGLPIVNGSPLAVDSGVTSTILAATIMADNASSGNPIGVLYTGGDTYLNFSNGTSAPRLSPENANDSFVDGGTFSFSVSIPIEGWSAFSQFLGAIPIHRTAVVSSVTGTLASIANGMQTRSMNTIQESQDFVSLDSGGVRLKSGTYILRGFASAYRTDHTKLYFYNVDDGAYVNLDSKQSFSNNVSGQSIVTPIESVSVTIEESKTFELRQYTQAAVSNGLTGSVASLTGDVGTALSKSAYIEITKVK